MPKLLIVDDEAATVDMLSTYLTLLGHEAIGAYSGEEGLSMTAAENPDLLILDLMMPDIQGFEVIKRLRNLQQYKSLPILIVSARTDMASKDKARNLGANGYLTKPIELAMLTSEINRLLASVETTSEDNSTTHPKPSSAVPSSNSPDSSGSMTHSTKNESKTPNQRENH